MSDGPRITVVLPCYNELEHIERSVAKIRTFMSYVYSDGEYELLLIDDCSTDGTREWLRKLQTPNVRVHFNETNLGRGKTVKAGIAMSTSPVVGFMDIDCEVAEYYLAEFCMKIDQGADLAVAQRIYRVAAKPYIILRHLLSSVYKIFLNRIIECSVKDTEAGYKFFSRGLADAIVAQSRFDGWFFDTECVLLAERWNCKIAEIPVAFLRNPQKTSTVKVFRDSFNYLKDIRRFLGLKREGAYVALLDRSRN